MGSLIAFTILVVSFVVFAQALFSLYLMLYSWEHPDRLEDSRGPRSFLPPRLSFSILLPARHEEAVIFRTIKSVWAADYPSDLMELVVICHADDTGTIAEAQRAIREIGSRRVRVETFSSGPINKPHGLEVGFQRTTNEVVTIFDAEDDVDPDIFNVINTVMLEEERGIVQAGVQLMNFRDAWFSAHNCLEYFFYFKSRLHFHAKVGMIPLGGNTVFIRRNLLERIGGWDQNCLTEDADIGLRLSALGEPIRVVYDAQHVTREETPDSVSSFIRQRTRWNQGFLQILKKGSWLSLPTLGQRLLAFYTLTYPAFHGAVTILWPFALVAILLVKVPVSVATASFLPLYALLLQLVICVVGVFAFAREYGMKCPISVPISMAITYLPFQFLQGYSALRAVYREARNQNNWEKTEHLGAHRRPEIALPSRYELLLEKAFDHLDVERGSVMVLDEAQGSFSIKASRGLPSDVVGSTNVDPGQGVAGWVIQNDTPVVINGQVVPAELQARLNQPDLLSSVILPLKQGGSTVAVLSLSSKKTELNYDDLRWLSNLVSAFFTAPTATANGGLSTREEIAAAQVVPEPDDVRPWARPNGHRQLDAPAGEARTLGPSSSGRRARSAWRPSNSPRRRRRVTALLIGGTLIWCLTTFWSGVAKENSVSTSLPDTERSRPSDEVDTQAAATTLESPAGEIEQSRQAEDPTRLPEPTIIAEHMVVKGDSLVNIAKRYYGDASLWPLILESNRTGASSQKITDPQKLHPNSVLEIPKPEDHQITEPTTDSGVLE